MCRSMNEAGLSVGGLTEQSAKNFATSAVNNGTEVLFWYDILNYLLSEFATVQEIKEQFVPGDPRCRERR